MSMRTRKLELNWGELGIDKAIDLVLIFLGLYAAIAVQDCADRAKDHQEYLGMLESFRTELGHNRAQRAALEASIGPMAEADPAGPTSNLGPLRVLFDEFQAQAQEAERLMACLGKLLGAIDRPPRSAEALNELAACGQLLEGAEQSAAAKRPFKPVSLTPLYRDDVWQLYLAGGVRVFENQALAIQIGATYSQVARVERAVAELESVLNDAFMARIGALTGSLAELEELAPAEGQSPKQARAQAARLELKLAALSKEIRAHKFAIQSVRGVVELKVQRLKEGMQAMDEGFGAASESIERELGARRG
jgi:hypothetical protein